MFTVRETEHFKSWFADLRDRAARARIDARIRRLSLGNAGDWKSVGGGVSEMRVDHGPGYRIYFTRRGQTVYVLLTGGEKSSQERDIEIAQAMAKDLEE